MRDIGCGESRVDVLGNVATCLNNSGESSASGTFNAEMVSCVSGTDFKVTGEVTSVSAPTNRQVNNVA